MRWTWNAVVNITDADNDDTTNKNLTKIDNILVGGSDLDNTMVTLLILYLVVECNDGRVCLCFPGWLVGHHRHRLVW